MILFEYDMNRQIYKILWVDDEIDLLKPYILFLEEKNYNVITFNDPYSLLNYIKTNKYIKRINYVWYLRFFL